MKTHPRLRPDNLLFSAIMVIILLIVALAAQAQDVIHLKNGGEIKAKVISIDQNWMITYKTWDNLEGPEYKLNGATDAIVIIYENGTKFTFSKSGDISPEKEINTEKYKSLKTTGILACVAGPLFFGTGIFSLATANKTDSPGEIKALGSIFVIIGVAEMILGGVAVNKANKMKMDIPSVSIDPLNPKNGFLVTTTVRF